MEDPQAGARPLPGHTGHISSQGLFNEFPIWVRAGCSGWPNVQTGVERKGGAELLQTETEHRHRTFEEIILLFCTFILTDDSEQSLWILQ